MSAGAPPQTPLGELTVLPRAPNWIYGAPLLRKGKGRGKGESDLEWEKSRRARREVRGR